MIPTPSPTSHRRRTAGLRSLLLASALLAWSVPATAQTPPDHQSDKTVASLIEQVEKARNKFDDSLEKSVKEQFIRSPTGEVAVYAYLQDLKDNVKKLRERYVPGYAASAELETVLKQCNAIDTYVQANPNMVKGRSEWYEMAASLKTLAGVYGASFPLPAGAPVRRISDGEAAEAIGAYAESANQFKKAIADDPAALKPDKDAGKKLADGVSNSAKALKSRVTDGKPAGAEAKAFFDQLSKLDSYVSAHPTLLSASSIAAMQTTQAKLQQAFGVKPIGR